MPSSRRPLPPSPHHGTAVQPPAHLASLGLPLAGSTWGQAQWWLQTRCQELAVERRAARGQGFLGEIAWCVPGRLGLLGQAGSSF